MRNRGPRSRKRGSGWPRSKQTSARPTRAGWSWRASPPTFPTRDGSLPPAVQILPAPAPYDVVVHEARGLHVGVHDGRAYEGEAAPLQVLAQRVGLARARRNLAHALPAVALRLAADEAPDVRVEGAELLLHLQERTRVLDGGADLEPVADDAGVGEQPARLARAEARDLRGIEAGERLAVGLAL